MLMTIFIHKIKRPGTDQISKSFINQQLIHIIHIFKFLIRNTINLKWL